MATLCQAMAAVTSGIAEVVLVWRAMNERSAYRFGQPLVPPSGGVVNVAGNGTGSLLCGACPLWRANACELGGARRAALYGDLLASPIVTLARFRLRSAGMRLPTPLAWFYGRTDYSRRASAVALDRRAGAAAARLLPGK